MREVLKNTLIDQILEKNKKATAASLRFPENLVKQYEKDLNPEQKLQFEEYKKDLINQIRSRRDLLERTKKQDQYEARNSTGLKIGEYNPNFRDLLKSELERQINEKKLKSEQEKQKRQQEDIDRLKRAKEASNRMETESRNGKMSTRRLVREMVGMGYEKAWRGKDGMKKREVVDKDIVPERDIRSHKTVVTSDGGVDSYNHLKQKHSDHDVVRRRETEDDYWFVKRLVENEQEIVKKEEVNKLRINNTLQDVHSHDHCEHDRRVIIGSKLLHV